MFFEMGRKAQFVPRKCNILTIYTDNTDLGPTFSSIKFDKRFSRAFTNLTTSQEEVSNV